MRLKHSANKFNCPESRNYMTYIDRSGNTGSEMSGVFNLHCHST